MLAAHPGSGGKQKNWPAARFAELMAGCARKWGRVLAPRWLLICGPADEQVCQEVLNFLAAPVGAAAKEHPVIPRLVRGVSLVHLAAILAACKGYVGNDSGVTHIAAAVGTPTLAVFGPTDPKIWGPVGPNVRTVPPRLPAIASATAGQ